MSIKLVLTRNTVSGQVGFVPESYLTHPVLGKTLERVKAGTKSLLPEMHAEQDTTESKATRTRKKAVVEDEAPVEPDASVSDTVN